MRFWKESADTAEVRMQYIEWVSRTRTVREVAGMLSIARTGFSYQDEDIALASSRMHAISGEYDLSPEDMELALSYQDPGLLEDWNHQILEYDN